MTSYIFTGERYFTWLCELVETQNELFLNHTKLMRELYAVAFDPVINKMDVPRVIDGIDLRYRFGQEQDISRDKMGEEFLNSACSVLEVLVALALRFEEEIMSDPDVGDRTPLWFWIMIQNLGLDVYDDNNFSYQEVDDILDRFIHREYNRDGSGGNIFIIRNRPQDIRKIDIWYQMCWFMSDFIRED